MPVQSARTAPGTRWWMGAITWAAAAVWTPAGASVVETGYLPLSDGTLLGYTVTRPDAPGRYPVLLKYDPYAAGVFSDPTWNDAGYVTLGVNMRGTGCSQGVFPPLRADVWGADGAEVVDWAATQAWSSGAIGMIGYSFTGVSQLATAAFSGPALKAITPGNVFLDFYRDSIYPGGIHNGWIPAWILIGRGFVVGSAAVTHAPSDPACAQGMLLAQPGDMAQSADTQLHPYDDAYWAAQPAAYLDRVRVPVLGCVTWQDTTIYSRAGDAFRERLNPQTTWLIGSNGDHADCPTSRVRLQRFFDRYLKRHGNGWESTPRVLLVHELAEADGGVRETLGEDAGAWQTGFASWQQMTGAIEPLRLYLRAGGRLDGEAPVAAEAPDSYAYPLPTANTPTDWTGGFTAWNDVVPPGGTARYTTPALAQDVEFLGGGSVDLWVSSTAPDTDLQVTLSEVRPDDQELYVQNGWLRLSHRRLDPARSTALRPWHTHREADAELLTPGEPVAARIEVLPFNHVFRAGSALRLTIDAPGGWFQIVPTPAQNTIHHDAAMPSALVLGRLPHGRALAPLPACGTLNNQPCRANTVPVPAGSQDPGAAKSGALPASTSPVLGAGAITGTPLLLLWVLALRRQRRNYRCRSACGAPNIVMPAKAKIRRHMKVPDARFRGHDGNRDRRP